jgi:hypothetical protein
VKKHDFFKPFDDAWEYWERIWLSQEVFDMNVLDLLQGPHLARELLRKIMACKHKRTSQTTIPKWCADCGAIEDPRVPGEWHLPAHLDKAKILDETGAFDESAKGR